jgi:hypothetical protein
MKKKTSTKFVLSPAAAPYRPDSKPSRIVALTGREVELLIHTLNLEWSSLQSRIVEFSAGDDSASSRAARRRVEEVEILADKLRGRT